MPNISPQILKDIIKDLEQPNPDDPAPGATRGLVQHLRAFDEHGVEEMMEGIESSIVAAFGAIITFAPTAQEGITVAMVLCAKVATEWQKGAAAAQRAQGAQGAPQTKGTH